jgi:NADH dehydrogenase
MREKKKTVDQTTKGAIVLVDGATGYIGSHLVADLIRNELRVRCLVREGAHKDDISFLSGLGAEIVRSDLSELSAKTSEAFQDVSAAVHLIGSIAPKRGETFEDLHVEPTAKFAALCQKANVPKAIMVTALGTAANAKSHYHQSKWRAECILRDSKVPAIFLRPSLLVGRTTGNRDSKLVKRYCELIKTKKTIPLIGGGTNRIQPLFIDDMVAVLRKSIQMQAGGVGNDAHAFDLAGPNSMTMGEFVKDLMKVMGVERNLVAIPVPIAKLIAMLAEKAQELPIISQDQVILATTDNVCQNNHISTIFNIKPSHINIALRSYGSGKESETVSARGR